MRIKCGSCGKALNVSDGAAGKKAKCPACKKVFMVPAAPAEPAAAPPPAPAAAPPELDMGLSPEPELGFTDGPGSGASECRNCGKPMAKDAIICVNCGFNATTGEKVGETEVAGGASGGGFDVSGSMAGVLKYAIRIAIILALVVGGYFGYKKFAGGVGTHNAFELIRGGKLREGIAKFKETRAKASPEDRKKLDLYISQFEQEAKLNTGKKLQEGGAIDHGGHVLRIEDGKTMRSGTVLKFSIENKTDKPLTLTKDLFYLRGKLDIVTASTHESNNYEGVVVPAGEKKQATIVFRSLPHVKAERHLGKGGTQHMYSLILNTGETYSKKSRVY